jgi:DNA repair exonuclease SbcCD ATPase subunit
MTNLITFKKIILDSFLSYDHEEMELDSVGIVYIKGENINESKTDSNGSGKSALISESLLWCLTGKTSRGASTVKNMFLERGPYVSVFFNKEGVDYEVTRGTLNSLKPNGLTIIKNGENVTKSRISDTKEFFETEFPELSWSVLTSTLNLTQGLVGGFSMLSNRDRKEKLEELSKVDSFYELIKNLTDSRHKNLQSRLTEVEAKLSLLEQKKLTSQTLIDTYTKSLVELESKSNSQLDFEALESQYNDKLNLLKTQISNLQISLDETRKAYDEARSLELNATQAYSETQRDIREHELKITTNLAEIRRLQELVDKPITQEVHLAHVESKQCPTCFQAISDSGTDQLKSKLLLEISKIKEEKVNALTQVETLKISNGEIASVINSLNSELLAQDIYFAQVKNNLAGYTATLNEQSKEISTLNNEREQTQASLTLISKEKSIDNTQTINNFKNQVLLENKNLLTIAEEVKRLLIEKDSQLYLKDLSQWVVNNTPKGLRAYLLDGIVDFINMRSSEYSTFLFDNDLIQLKLDGTNLEIFLGDKPIENTSGGEHRRADIVIQLAIRDLVSEQTGFSSNLLIIDEVFDGLDSVGISTVLDLIISQKESINSIYLITHKSDANIPYDSILTVRKENNISKVLY